MKIEVLSTGCRKCQTLYENAQTALAACGKGGEVIKVEGVAALLEHGVLSPPALVIDGELKVSGKLLSADEIQRML